MEPSEFVVSFLALLVIVFGLAAVCCLVAWALARRNRRREVERQQQNFLLENTWVDETDRCGHRTFLRARIDILGQSRMLTLPFNKTGGVDYCHRCVAEAAKSCIRCHEPILPGAPISFEPYHPRMGVVEQILLEQHVPQVLGCTRYDCVANQDEAFVGYLQQGCVRLVSGDEVPFTLLQTS